MVRICDMHCHLLPGLDDGAKDMEETMQALQEAIRQGVHTIIATPHCHPGRYQTTGEEVMSAWRAVNAECRKRQLPIRLLPGQECYYYSGLLEELETGRALTLAGSEYVLVEFSPDCLFGVMTQGLRMLQSRGYRPILAHFERYACLREMEHLESIRGLGVLLQMNYDTLLAKDGLFRKKPWKQLVREGRVDFLSSDCHGMDFRPLHADQCRSWLERHTSTELCGKLLYGNVEKIILEE